MAFKVVMKSADYIKLLHHIQADLKTDYNNKYPYNLGYNHGSYWSWDCWNLPKTILWGWNEKIAKGKWQPKNTSIGLGDWNGWTILNCCSNISTDFSKLTPSEFMLTKDKGHVGTYMGEFTIDGKVYNVIECTSAWSHNVLASYVDANGNRSQYKGGAKKNTPWHWHGLLPWLDYTEPPKNVVAVDGSWGMATTRYTQKMLGTPVTGKVGGQPRSNKKYLPAASTASWQFKLTGAKGSAMVKALQKKIGVKQDGKFGKQSVTAFQNYLKKKGFYNGDVTGVMDASTVKAWQRYINHYFANK